MGQIDTRAGIIGLDRSGACGGATPILFLHGVGSDKSVWRPQLEHFGKARLALAIDYPGYCESAFQASATRDDFARAAFAALDALGIEQVHVCGLSLGGVVAIAMHALHPGRCASLILADSFAVHPDGAAIFARSVAASETMSMRALAEARAPLLLGGHASAALSDEVVTTMAGIDPAAFRLGAAAVWLADQRERAAAITVQALLVVGAEDRITPPALSDELARLITGSKRVTIAGAGHLANIEQPALFNQAVEEFLSDCDQLVEG